MKTLSILIIVFSLIHINGCSNRDGNEVLHEIPHTKAAFIKANGKEYEMEPGNYRWDSKEGSNTVSVMTDHAGPLQMAENLKPIIFTPNQNIEIAIEQNLNLKLLLWNENGSAKEISIKKNKFILPAAKGKYIYEVLAEWPDGEVSYTFVAEVQ